MTPTVDISELHRYTVDEYEALVEKGAFDEDLRAELIDGLLLDMSPKSPPHENAIRWLHNDWLIRSLDLDRYAVAVGSPIRLANSEPEPDVMVLDRSVPRPGHPTSSPLVIEVAFTSGDRDLTIKPRLYAPAVDEYWVLDLRRRALITHRDPSGEYYKNVSIHTGETLIEPHRLELDPLPLARLLAAL